jgi:hypothetical protein
MKEYEPENEQNILGIKILNFFIASAKGKYSISALVIIVAMFLWKMFG